MSEAADVAARFAAREPWTQSLEFAAGQQDRGWACLLAGGAIIGVQPRDDGAHGRIQRARVIDVPQIQGILRRVPMARFVVEPALRGVIVDADGARRSWRYDLEHNAFEALATLGWTPVRRHRAHTKTIVVDLRPGMDEVTRRFATVARRNVRKAQRTDVTYRYVAFDEASDEVRRDLSALNRTFLDEHSGLVDEGRVRASIIAHLVGKGGYVLAYDGEALVGAVYLVMHDRVASYFVAQSTRAAQAKRVPTGLVHAAMSAAVTAGCELFDFVGVYDERFPAAFPSWKGFTSFKERFGGHPISLPPGLQVPLPDPNR